MSNYFFSQINVGTSCTPGGFLSQGNLITYNPYTVKTGYILLESATDTLFDDLNSVLINNTTYTYNLNNMKVSKSVVRNSKNEIIETDTKFPVDFENTSDTSIIVLMQKNKISAIVEQTMKKITLGLDTFVIGSIHNEYYSSNLELSKQFKLEITSPTLNFSSATTQIGSGLIFDTKYRPTILFNKYDDRANLLEFNKVNNLKEVYLWGYNSQYPVAKVTGSDYETVKGLISQAILDNPATTDQQMRDELNNIRNGLAETKALVTTYTYKPLVGMTSECDINNRITYYEYDGFGSLIHIRDQDKKYPIGEPHHC